ncbi:putative GPI-anchored protein pfl2 [Branchiostoma floridae]|uniref:Homeobox protein prophet of Pit-1 n=1 Tax=Branchiostoma floridae TaxID=7739 RepID=A0A9J7LG72_BRAFL|nr:putative GPI-anchored protein pfl2 [Branchiostoma floridae]XP_035681648.1 putative GPI-anchored protein pfl2 [Branchiostoma floridae]
MAGKESEADLEEDDSDENPRISPKAAKEKNSKVEVISKSSSRKQEETRIQVLSRACDEKEKSNKPESEKAQKVAEDEKVNTPYETRIRVKRQKIMKEGVEKSRTSPACKEQELIMDTSEEEETKCEEVNKVGIADGDAEEQDKNKRLTDDVECLSSRVGDVGRTLELKVSSDRQESSEAGTSEDQKKQSNADIRTENGPMRMRKQSVRDADDVTENGPMRRRELSVRHDDAVTEDGPMRRRELSVRDDDDVTENEPMRRRELSVRDADDVTENEPMRRRELSVRHDDAVTEDGPMRRRELSVRDTDDVTENGPVRMRKQNLRDAEVVTDDGPIAKRIRTRLGAVREAEEETAEGSVTRVGDGRGNQQVKVGEGGDMTTRPPWRDGRRRRCRTKYSKEQLMAMEELFMKNRYPDIVEREDLAERIGLTEDRIQVWFQNRRSRWRARERKMQKAAEGVAARCSQSASNAEVPSDSAGATSQPARPLPVLIIPAAGFPMMQQYFSAMSSGNVTDGAKDHRSTGMPMVLQCPPADHSQHAQGAAPTTSSNSSAEVSNITTSSATKPASNSTTSSTVTRPRTIAPKLDPQKLPFPYTIGFAYFPSQGAGTKGLANRENQTVSASLVIPANQGQLGSVQGHRGGGPGPTLSPLLRAVESELQAKNVPVSVAPTTPRNVAKNRNASKEACSSSMQLRSRSVRPIAPMPTGSRTTQRRHSTGARYPLPADDPQEPTVGDGIARKTQVESMVMSQSVTPLSATRHRSSITGQREGFSQIDNHPSTSMLTSLGTGFTRIDHSGRIHAQHSHESSPASPVPFQPIQRRRSRTFSEGSGGCVPTGCFLSKAYAQSRSEGAGEADSTLLTGMRRPASLQIPQPQRQGSSSSCRVKKMSDNQGVILEDRSSTEIFRVPPRRRANSLTQPVFRQDATPTLKAPAIPVSYGQSVARGSRMPQALFEDMHSPPPRARVASLSDILPCTRQNRDKHTSVFQNERSDDQPMHSVPSAASTVPPVSDVISLAFRTVNSPAQSAPKYVGSIPHATVTRNDISGRLETGPIAANKHSPRPLLQGKRDESDDIVFMGKVSSQNKPEVEQQDSVDRNNPNFVVLESSDAPHAVLNHEELTSCTDMVERGHDGNNNLSPLRQIKNVVDSIDKPDVVTVHETVPPQDHQQPYPSTQQDEHGHVNTFTGLLVGADTTSGGVTNDTIAASEVNGRRMPETCGQVVSQEQVPAEAWMEENPNSSASSIYETPRTASSRFIQVPNQHQPYTSSHTSWRSDTLPNRSDVVPVAFAPTMSHANQQCLYTGTTSFQNQSHHGATGSYGRMVQPWGGDPAQTQQQGAGNITMNALFLWQQNINLAQQVSLTNILARHNPFPKTQMLLTNPQPASIPTTNHVLGTSHMMTPTNEQSSTGMTSHPPTGLGATPRPVGDYYTSSSTKLTYVNSNRNWFGLNGQGLPPTAIPGVQRMNNQGILSGQLSAQGLQTFHK